MKRAPRGCRPTGRRHRLTERDIDILTTVARMRAPTSKQLTALFFRTPSALHRRVRALHALGLVQVRVTGLNEPNTVILTARGAALVEQEGLPRDEIHVARRVERLDPHAELVGDLRVGFVLAARRRDDLEIEAMHLDHDLRRAVGHAARDAYIPDALAVFTVGGSRTTLAYEIDRGFEPTSEIRRKVSVTLDLARCGASLYGYAPWRPVLLVPTGRRLATLARHISDAGAGDLWACGLLEACTDPTAARYALAESLRAADDPVALLRSKLVP